jgi:hypothetical protein
MPIDLSIPSDFDGSHHLYGKKSTDLPDLIVESTDFVSCCNSDKSSDEGSTSFASCDSSEKSDLPKTTPKTSPNTPHKPSRVVADNKTVSTEDLFLNSLQNNNFSSVKNNSVYHGGLNTFSCYTTSFGLNKSSKKKKCFLCGSKYHLIKDCTFHEQRMGECVSQRKPRQMWKNVSEIPSFVPHQQKSNSAESHSSWRRTSTRPYVRPTSSFFSNGYWPNHFDSMYYGGGYWNTAVKSSAGCSWTKKGPNMQFRPKNNGGSKTSTWPITNDPQGRLKSAMT